MTRRKPKPKSLRLLGGGVLASTVLVLAALVARAEPLPKDACDLLSTEHDRLIAAGVKAWMAQGTPEARSRLGPEKLGQVGRFLEIDEQLLFRCGLYKVRFVLPADVEEAVAEPAPAVKAPGPNRDTSPPKSKAKPEPDRKNGKQAASAPASEPAAAKPAAKKKAKTEDAYRPEAPAVRD